MAIMLETPRVAVRSVVISHDWPALFYIYIYSVPYRKLSVAYTGTSPQGRLALRVLTVSTLISKQSTVTSLAVALVIMACGLCNCIQTGSHVGNGLGALGRQGRLPCDVIGLSISSCDGYCTCPCQCFWSRLSRGSCASSIYPSFFCCGS